MPCHISSDSALWRAGWLKTIQPMPASLWASMRSVFNGKRFQTQVLQDPVDS